MTRGLPAREVILPAGLLLKLLRGWPNCTVLVRLNTSQRNGMPGPRSVELLVESVSQSSASAIILK